MCNSLLFYLFTIELALMISKRGLMYQCKKISAFPDLPSPGRTQSVNSGKAEKSAHNNSGG
jgi:hypothetical protein